MPYDTIDTPEGRAIYPFGSWGVGYLADDATERRLRTYLGRMIWVMTGFFTLQSVVRLVFRMPELVALAGAYAAFLVFHYAVVKTILRASPRASFRPTTEELLQRRLGRGGRTSMVAAHWCGLVACGAIAIMIAIVTEGLERWIVESGCVASLLFLAFSLRRLQRLPD